MFMKDISKKFEETQFSKVRLEFSVRNTFNTVKDQDMKEGCCFKKRIADLFLIGVSKAFSNNVLKKILSKKDSYDAFNISPKETSDKKIRTLADKDKFWRLFQLIAYAHNIIDAGTNKDSEEWKKSHYVITDGTNCTRIVEEYFKGGWLNPSYDSYFKLISSDFPDDKIIEELGIMDQFFEEED